jgi:hypothetical protein
MPAGLAHRRGLRGMRLAAGNSGTSATLIGRAGRRAAHRHVVPAPVAHVAARHHLERQTSVAHRSGVRALHRHQDAADRPAVLAAVAL